MTKEKEDEGRPAKDGDKILQGTVPVFVDSWQEEKKDRA